MLRFQFCLDRIYRINRIGGRTLRGGETEVDARNRRSRHLHHQNDHPITGENSLPLRKFKKPI